jgi:hypothetical protein
MRQFYSFDHVKVLKTYEFSSYAPTNYALSINYNFPEINPNLISKLSEKYKNSFFPTGDFRDWL